MFLEESFQLEPGTITKIKEQKQVAQGPQDMQTQEDMTIQPGSGDMQEIMQSVGAPQRAAQGGRMGLGRGGNAFWDDKSWEEFDRYNDETETGKAYLDEQDAIFEKFAKRFPNINTDNMRIQDMLALLQAEGIVGVEGLGLSGMDQALGMINPESLDRSVQRISRGDTQYGDIPEEIFQGGVGQVGAMQHGGRIGYQTGEQVLPMPRPTEEDPRAAFFERMGAMPEQTLLRQPQSMNAMSGQMRGQGQGIMGQTQDPFGGLLGGEEGDIGMGGQPLVEYEHEGAEEPPSWWDRMRTGTTGTPLENDVSPMGQGLDMDTIIDFLKKMGMAITKENIAKAAQALGMAMKFGEVSKYIPGLGIAGLQSLGAPEEEIEETETEQMFQDGGITNAVPRQGYGLGDIVGSVFSAPKKILKSAKKILKSDLGKMAMMYIATAGMGNVAATQGMGGAQKWFGKGGWQWLKPSKAFGIGEEGFGNIGQALSRLTSKVPYVGKKNVAETLGSDFVTHGKALAGTGELTGGANILPNAYKLAEMTDWDKAASLAKLGTKELTKAAKPWYKGALPWIAGASLAGGLYTAANPGEEQFDMGKRDEEVNKWTQWLAGIPPADDIVYPYPNYTGAQGGRVGVRDGGIMNLDGGEKDYRNTGGFVDIGAKEKADDVPARLSVNEFVMTADAVRGAGDGDVDQGAERLQQTMKQLEQKGKRHKAAQGMFATSQRLGEVI